MNHATCFLEPLSVGVAVRIDGCYQPNDPACPGDVPMSVERAKEYAHELALRLGYDGVDFA